MTSPEPAARPEPLTLTASTPGGVQASLTLPGGYRHAPELERDGVLLAGVWDRWPGPGEQPATTTLSIGEATPELASVHQLCLAVIAQELSAGRYVVAVDCFEPPAPEAEAEVDDEEAVTAGPGADPDTRRIISLELVRGLPVQRTHYLTFRAGRPVRLVSSVDITKWDLGLRILAFEVARLSVRDDGSGELLAPAPDVLPAMAVRGDGVELEELGDIAVHQPYRSQFPPIDPADLARLRGTTGWRPARGARLEAAGLVTHLGRLTDRGSSARGLLRKAKGRVSAELVVPGIEGERLLDARIEREFAVVTAEDPVGDNTIERTVDVIGREELPLMLARWIAVAPGWPLPFEAEVDVEPWSARMTDPEAPAPPGASDALEQFWHQPWRLVEVTARGGKFGHAYMHWLLTPERGACTVRFSDAGVTLTRQPTAEVFRMLAMMCDVIPRQSPARTAASAR